MSSASLRAIDQTGPDIGSVKGHEVCSEFSDRRGWHRDVRAFFDYWLQIKPPGWLPGRQHFDVLDIPLLMPRVWLLDVLREPLRYRYRLVGTKKVEAIGREVTGQFFDDVHGASPGRARTRARLDTMVTTGLATHRKGPVGLEPDRSRRHVENCMVPFARDGVTVDLIGVHSIVFDSHGAAV